MADVTDATFDSEVVQRSKTVPVVIDLWAEWCGPCKQLGPIIEKVVAETNGKVELAKVDVDANPAVSQAFKVQSIPAVYAMVDGQIVDSFTGAQGEAQVREFVTKLIPEAGPTEVDLLVEAGDEQSLRQAFALEPTNPAVVVPLAELLVGQGFGEDAQTILDTVPETAEVRRVQTMIRTGQTGVGSDDELETKLSDLLSRVKGNNEVRQEFVDTLELMGPDDPRTADWRRRLSTALY
ncbi:MAG: tetratricopeptide repeat protein [Acidimicrobiales bacterium]